MNEISCHLKFFTVAYVKFRGFPYLDKEEIKKDILHTPIASVVARGTRVLARRSDDGFYYTAHIAQEVQVCCLSLHTF